MNVQIATRKELFSRFVGKQRWPDEEDAILDEGIPATVQVVLELPVLFNNKQHFTTNVTFFSNLLTIHSTYTTTSKRNLVLPPLQIQPVEIVLKDKIAGTEGTALHQRTAGRRYRGTITRERCLTIGHGGTLDLVVVTGVRIDANGNQGRRQSHYNHQQRDRSAVEKGPHLVAVAPYPPSKTNANGNTRR